MGLLKISGGGGLLMLAFALSRQTSRRGAETGDGFAEGGRDTQPGRGVSPGPANKRLAASS
jgi:hypothetical protein